MSALIAARPSVFRAVLSTGMRQSYRCGSVVTPNPWNFTTKRVKDFKHIPGPRALPLVGNVWKYYLGKYPLESIPAIYEDYQKKYGPLVKERLFFRRTLVHVFDPLDMNKIYFLERGHLPQRISHRALDEYRQSKPEMYKNGGLAAINGKRWRNLRRSLGENLLTENSNEAFEMVTDDLITIINSRASISNDLSLLPMLYFWTLECMGAVALGQRLGSFSVTHDSRLEQFLKCVHTSQRAVLHTENLPPIFTRRYTRQLADCQKRIHTFLWPLLNNVVTKNELGEKDSPIALRRSIAYDLIHKDLDERDVSTLIIDMFQGGIHSTANVMAFALYHLAMNPDIQKDVRASLMEKFPNVEDKISSQPLDEKVKNVIRETMRLNPPTIGTSRVLPEPLVLSSYRVPKGTMCILHHQIASKQKEYFENPDEFNPDRFNDPNLSKAAIVANSPFALGKRSCPGRPLALNELAIGLSKILRLYELSYNYEKVGTRNCLINEPDKDIKITFKPTPMNKNVGRIIG